MSYKVFSASLAKELREMSHDDFLKLSQAVYGSLLRCVHGVQAQSQVISTLLTSVSYVAPIVAFTQY